MPVRRGTYTVGIGTGQPRFTLPEVQTFNFAAGGPIEQSFTIRVAPGPSVNGLGSPVLGQPDVGTIGSQAAASYPVTKPQFPQETARRRPPREEPRAQPLPRRR